MKKGTAPASCRVKFSVESRINEMKPVIGISTCLEQQGGDGEHWHEILDIDYVRLIEENGMVPLLLPFTRRDDIASEIMERVNGLLISGGRDIHPRFYGEVPGEAVELAPDMRVNYDLKLVRRALAESSPLLAVCYGLQLLNVAQGGTLYQDISQVKGATPHRKGTHPICLREGSKLHGLFQADAIGVNSFHHQSIKRLGENLKIAAVALDGVVEAVEHEGAKFVLGVQWHLERNPGKVSRKIMEAFRKAC